jgi:hypothetical protein
VLQICNPFHDNGFMPCTHQCFVGLKFIKFELGVQVCVQGKYFPLTQLNYCHKSYNEDILQLVEVDEIVNKLQKGKFGSKLQHDLHIIIMEVKVCFCLFIIRAINGHFHQQCLVFCLNTFGRDNILIDHVLTFFKNLAPFVSMTSTSFVNSKCLLKFLQK